MREALAAISRAGRLGANGLELPEREILISAERSLPASQEQVTWLAPREAPCAGWDGPSFD